MTVATGGDEGLPPVFLQGSGSQKQHKTRSWFFGGVFCRETNGKEGREEIHHGRERRLRFKYGNNLATCAQFGFYS